MDVPIHCHVWSRHFPVYPTTPPHRYQPVHAGGPYVVTVSINCNTIGLIVAIALSPAERCQWFALLRVTVLPCVLLNLPIHASGPPTRPPKGLWWSRSSWRGTRLPGPFLWVYVCTVYTPESGIYCLSHNVNVTGSPYMYRLAGLEA